MLLFKLQLSENNILLKKFGGKKFIGLVKKFVRVFRNIVWKNPNEFFGQPVIRSVLFFFFFNIYLFLAVLGLCCCVWAFSSCSERGLLFVVVHGLLIAVASLVAEHGL